MTGSERLLDTNIVSAAAKGDAAVLSQLGRCQVLLPVIVVGELLFGAEIGARRESSLQSLREMVSKVEVLGCTTDTAFHYARIKAALRRSGRPIPENDLWIAAIAMQNEMTLVSRDVHFAEIEGLALERW